ncbi:MAG: hypothetical protein GY842_02240 [bacterium]|nr:hypothetical protein [bacterium]
MLRSAFSQPTCIVVLILLAWVVAAAPGAAGEMGLTTYQCTIDIVGSWHDCTDDIVTVTTSSDIYRVTQVDLSSGYLRLDAFVEVCDATGWWIHFGDSPSCNGGGGDALHTEHDAEAYVHDTKFEMVGTYNTERSALEPGYSSEAVIAASGCYWVHWTIYEDRVFFDDDGDPADTPQLELHSVHGFESAPYDEPDTEDPSGLYADLWYVGMNRTVWTASRNGTGVSEVCFVLSTTTAPDPAVLSALCP